MQWRQRLLVAAAALAFLPAAAGAGGAAEPPETDAVWEQIARDGYIAMPLSSSDWVYRTVRLREARGGAVHVADHLRMNRETRVFTFDSPSGQAELPLGEVQAVEVARDIVSYQSAVQEAQSHIELRDELPMLAAGVPLDAVELDGAFYLSVEVSQAAGDESTPLAREEMQARMAEGYVPELKRIEYNGDCGCLRVEWLLVKYERVEPAGGGKGGDKPL